MKGRGSPAQCPIRYKMPTLHYSELKVATLDTEGQSAGLLVKADVELV